MNTTHDFDLIAETLQHALAGPPWPSPKAPAFGQVMPAIAALLACQDRAVTGAAHARLSLLALDALTRGLRHGGAALEATREIQRDDAELILRRLRRMMAGEPAPTLDDPEGPRLSAAVAAALVADDDAAAQIHLRVSLAALGGLVDTLKTALHYWRATATGRLQ